MKKKTKKKCVTTDILVSETGFLFSWLVVVCENEEYQFYIYPSPISPMVATEILLHSCRLDDKKNREDLWMHRAFSIISLHCSSPLRESPRYASAVALVTAIFSQWQYVCRCAVTFCQRDYVWNDRSIASHITISNHKLFRRLNARCFNRNAYKICVTKNHWHVDLLFPVFVVTPIAFFLLALKCNRFFPFVPARCCNGKCRSMTTLPSNIIKIIVREIEITGLFSLDKTNSVKNQFQYLNENFVVGARNSFPSFVVVVVVIQLIDWKHLSRNFTASMP